MLFLVYVRPVKAKLHKKDMVFHHAAVAADNAECSKVGSDVLKEGGSAVDSAIATMLCLGMQESFSREFNFMLFTAALIFSLLWHAKPYNTSLSVLSCLVSFPISAALYYVSLAAFFFMWT